MGFAAARVAVELLGRTRVLSHGEEVPLSRQCISVLAYLGIFRHLDHPRDVLIEHFWSSQEPSRARSCLGTTLTRLRKGLQIDGSNWLEVSSLGEPRISSSAPIWFDVVAFETAIAPAIASARGKLETSVLESLLSGLSHYHGDLLLGWYDDWVLTERERLRLLCLRGYQRLMDHYSATGELDAALDAGQVALRIEPLQEGVQQRVIELYCESGQRVAAVRQYEKLAILLKTELGISPSMTVTALIDRVCSRESH